MASSSEELAAHIDALSDLSRTSLRERLEELYGTAPPARMSSDLLQRAIAHRLQEQARGGLKPMVRRCLLRLANTYRESGEINLGNDKPTKAGTRIVREWQGELFEIWVLDEGYLWKGERYNSLSEIAGLITGTKWSGPRFFGLKRRPSEVQA